ncbi:hypothetical protein T281_01580 [Rhodomicrobium udaipurense JA643]|uniref:Tyrosine-type recombinase/integrase n=1 Tax=Rhodomicrobium udaipurense TaxID=1202716 RepID=A0A8I1GDS6_9HYPH|nr:tyrosine-type recombinase/integrase [Rhodomicrobium udaipurense]KAI96141.1 hypothetical protein T281_01580 [Rhodomicrobium udaipurense JA643]MBJ7545178.1 tyrosine-type recombinase/integrase [Rhodomicrobium udaipurense]
MIEANPMEGMRGPATSEARDRVLSDEELRAFWKAASDEDWPFENIFKLLLLTAQRREEVAAMRWAELDLDAASWTIAKERCKNGKEHTVDLHSSAVALLDPLGDAMAARVVKARAWADEGSDEIVFTTTVDTLADRLNQHGITADRVRDAIIPRLSPQLVARGFDPDQMTNIIMGRLQGQTNAQIAQANNLHPDTVARYWGVYQEANPTPLNLIEFADEIAGRAAGQSLARDARADFILSRDEVGANRLFQRQAEQPERMTRMFRGGDYDAAEAAAQQQLRSDMRTAYDAFYAQQPLDLGQNASQVLATLNGDRFFRRAVENARQQAVMEARAHNARNPGNPMPVPSNRMELTPQVIDYTQRALRAAAESRTNPLEARHAQNLRSVFLDEMDRTYPNTWPQIRRQYADAMTTQGAGELAANMANPKRTTNQIREALAEFQNMNAPQQELFRLAFERNLVGQIRSVIDDTGAANQFMTPAWRDFIREIYPAGDAARIIRNMSRERATTRTTQTVFGNSNTAQTTFDVGEALTGAKAAAGMATGNVRAILDNLAERISRQIGGAQARERLRMLTETDPGTVLRNLLQMSASARTRAERQEYLAAIREIRSSSPRMRQIGVLGADVERRLPSYR